jgi:hypothetical protein
MADHHRVDPARELCGVSEKLGRASVAPNRIISESCRSSKTLDQLSAEAERMFWRLTTVADDFGRFMADPALMATACFPLKVGTQGIVKDVGAWYEELEIVRLVQTYRIGERLYGFFVTWDDHQSRRAKYSKYPDPSQGVMTEIASPARRCEQVQADVSEESRKRGARKRGARSRDDRKAMEVFDLFWKLYPRKVNKEAARKAWLKLKPDEDVFEAIVLALGWQTSSRDWTRDGGQYIPYPASYLNGRRWEDEQQQEVVVEPAGFAALRSFAEKGGFDGDEEGSGSLDLLPAGGVSEPQDG